MLALIAVLGLQAAIAGGTSPSAELVAKIGALKQRITGAKSQGEKLDGLRALKRYVETDAQSLPSRATGRDERRKLVMTVEALRVYFGHVDFGLIREGKCDEARALISQSADPRATSPESLPGEAREASEALNAACAQGL